VLGVELPLHVASQRVELHDLGRVHHVATRTHPHRAGGYGARSDGTYLDLVEHHIPVVAPAANLPRGS
jgi:hypothetical protein